MTTATRERVRGGVGERVVRVDAAAKVDGSFLFSTDYRLPGMLWGATVRSTCPSGEITGIDITEALRLPGVRAVLTATDVPGASHVGLMVPDQAVLAGSRITHVGEPICIVAADDPERAREAAAAVKVTVIETAGVLDPQVAIEAGEVYTSRRLRRGPEDRVGSIVVETSCEILSQDQAPLGTESGLAIPDGSGGVDVYAASQWIHDDHRQLVEILKLADDQVRVHPVGIGGAFGAREDLTVNAHLCLLALATGRPVKMVLDRAESFLAHVHRHPAQISIRLEADADGRLAVLRSSVVVDGGAYASTSPSVVSQLVNTLAGPYRIDRVEIDAWAARTNNPPCGAMRGFGAVQACFAREAAIDELAAALDLDPLELRRRNLLARGDHLSTNGQQLTSSFPAAEVVEILRDMPLPDLVIDDPRLAPGGTGLTTPRSRVRRGIGVAVGIKGIAYGGGFDDYSDARVVIVAGGAQVHTAAIEVGQGLGTTLGQIARTMLGIEQVSVVFDHTGLIGSAGSSSASRQTQVSGGAVHDACQRLREQILAAYGADELDDVGVWRGSDLVATLAQVAEEPHAECTVRFRHPPTERADESGQGVGHADFAVFANRAVVDVDIDLGLVRVLYLQTAQDVGRVINPMGLVGQVEGGAAQGLGLAVMEGLVIENGRIRNGSFTDYLIPTVLDMPPVEMRFVEEHAAWGPLGAKGAGESPCIASGPAIAAAIRNATGRTVAHFPIRPEDLT